MIKPVAGRVTAGMAGEMHPLHMRLLRIVRPPYRHLEPWPARGLERLMPGSGLVLVLDPSQEEPGPDELLELVASLNHRLPGTPIVAWQSQDPPHPVLADLLGSERPPWVQGMRTGPYSRAGYLQLVCQVEASGTRAWLRTVGEPGSPGEVGSLEYLTDLLAGKRSSIPGGSSALHRSLQRMRLPRPRQWRMVAQALPVVLGIQQNRAPVARAAQDGRYSDPSALRRHCRQLFGAPPSALRFMAGWQCLLARFLDLQQPEG